MQDLTALGMKLPTYICLTLLAVINTLISLPQSLDRDVDDLKLRHLVGGLVFRAFVGLLLLLGEAFRITAEACDRCLQSSTTTGPASHPTAITEWCEMSRLEAETRNPVCIP